MLKVLGGLLIVGGGIYAVFKLSPNFLKDVKGKSKETGNKLKESFLDGYSKTVKA